MDLDKYRIPNQDPESYRLRIQFGSETLPRESRMRSLMKISTNESGVQKFKWGRFQGEKILQQISLLCFFTVI